MKGNINEGVRRFNIMKENINEEVRRFNIGSYFFSDSPGPVLIRVTDYHNFL